MKLLMDWLDANKLALNVEKTKYMIISPPKLKYSTTNLYVQINGQNIQQIGKNHNQTSLKFSHGS